MHIRFFQLDAFTNQLFKGNPAVVCILESWLDDEILQAIAKEINLSETVFIVQKHNDYHIRWFTPMVEVDLCGHGTLAASYVVLELLEKNRVHVTFLSASGPLQVSRTDKGYAMDFPVTHYETADVTNSIIGALGAKPIELYQNHNYLAVFTNERQIRDIEPDFGLLKKLPHSGVIITAKGDHVDFVSRYFAPKDGINEDPVTGSAHCMLASYWAEKSGKFNFHAKQLSQRGGDIYCELRGDRVMLTGNVKLFSQGKIII